MHSKTPLWGTISALILLGSALPAADIVPAKTYTINLSPPYQVGQKSTLVSDYADHQEIIVSAISPPPTDAPGQKQTTLTNIHLEAEIEVLAVFPDGVVQKETLTIKKFEVTQNNQIMAGLMGSGTKIQVSEAAGSEKKTFTVNDQPVPDALANLLRPVVSLGKSDHTDQDILGPKTPVAIGATWAPDKALLTEGSKDTLGIVTDVQGELKLDDVQGTGDDQVVSVSGTISLKASKAPLPANYVCDPVQLTSNLMASFPATRSKGVAKNSTTVHMQVSGISTDPTTQAKTKMTFTDEQKTTKAVTFH